MREVDLLKEKQLKTVWNGSRAIVLTNLVVLALVAAGCQQPAAKAAAPKILEHYGYTFDDAVVENVFTTNMAEFIKVSGHRNTIYQKQFPTGTWLEVKGLALPGQLIEIDMEAHKVK